MKKAKLMLAAIAVLAIAGGVYASKAKDITKFIYVPTTTLPTTFCPLKVTGYTLTENDLISFTTRATTISTLPCAITTVYSTL